jgi:hypothetical protein
MDINNAWEMIRENVKISARESLNYYKRYNMKIVSQVQIAAINQQRNCNCSEIPKHCFAGTTMAEHSKREVFASAL